MEIRPNQFLKKGAERLSEGLSRKFLESEISDNAREFHKEIAE